ncbi:MAG TPA: hypothetical protein PLJ29_08875 [Leptospiraceae bacterium]|nr:hypothetical protein [Leptospiraceae bacterium]
MNGFKESGENYDLSKLECTSMNVGKNGDMEHISTDANDGKNEDHDKDYSDDKH